MKSSRIPWPGDEGEERWNHAWQAIKKVQHFHACHFHVITAFSNQCTLSYVNNGNITMVKAVATVLQQLTASDQLALVTNQVQLPECKRSLTV